MVQTDIQTSLGGFTVIALDYKQVRVAANFKADKSVQAFHMLVSLTNNVGFKVT